MSPEQRFRLNNEQRLFPILNRPCQKHEQHSIGPGECWSFDLPTEDNELLA